MSQRDAEPEAALAADHTPDAAEPRRGGVGRLARLHVAALGLWAGCLAFAGVSAAVLFPTMKKLQPALPGFASYDGDHWMIAAGQAANRVFGVLGPVEWVLASIAVLTLVIPAMVRTMRGRLGMGWAVRAVLVLAAAGLLAFGSLVVQRRMNANSAVYWEAASAGQNERAGAAKASFQRDHPLASGLMQARLVCLLLALGAACAMNGAAGAAASGKDRA